MKTIQFKFTFLFILALGLSFTSCVEDDDFDIPDISITEPEIDGDIVSINAIQGIIEQNDGENFTIQDSIYVEGYVISSDEGGNFFEELIIQDKPENPTAGIRISVNANPLFTKYNFGRKVYVKMEGLTVGITNGVYAIGTVDGNRIGQIQESQADDVILRTSETAEIVPLPVSISDFSNELENLYIQLNNVQFPRSSVLVEEPLTFAAEPTDEFDGERVLESCDSGNTTIVSTSTFADFKTLFLPAQAGSMTGVLSRDFFDDFYVFLINSPEDINFDLERCDPDLLFCDGPSGGSNTIFEEDFEVGNINDLTGWTNVNVTGGNLDYIIGSFSGDSYAQISGFNSGETDSEAWLVTPQIDLSTSIEEDLSLEIQTNFDNGEILTIFITDNFTGDPTTTEWTQLDLEVPIGPGSGFGSFEPVGPTNISCAGENVWIGFRYISTDPDATTRYHIDDLTITGN
ncbi:DUF5689 domain-containing protein [Mesohalobacter halotolerans]|uniref:DUF5689 domain-containing protein n=1 Tax=Mesohalobacter halotolerans TaxID=1883405 RepID=A0A4U5TTS2_9FLAO|nr:DUF5689 domain-containing protein [Mesohalobacter halotolerans]MBS3737588.1 choice-of-anchor J domain-containing protein [Psychroflexus sp.]TKS57291.1 hypothetical protein FCN74_02405 [Mesohalobacter halotolerans]